MLPRILCRIVLSRFTLHITSAVGARAHRSEPQPPRRQPPPTRPAMLVIRRQAGRDWARAAGCHGKSP